MTAHRLATLEDMRQLPGDGHIYELVRGRIVVSPGGMRHSAIASRIHICVGTFVYAHQLGDAYTEGVGIVLPNGNLRSPDVSFIAAHRLPGGRSPVDFGHIAPDLAVEVLSPRDSAAAMAEKVEEYLDADVALVWVVDPEQREVVAYRPGAAPRTYSAADAITAEPVLPGFRASVSAFFP